MLVITAGTLFFISIFMIFYIYLGYPLLVFVWAHMNGKSIKKSQIFPSVSILISAFNEEEHIENTILNKLQLDYPKEKLQIIVISDGSTDKTDEIVKRYESECVQLIRQYPRAGKTSALNLAAPHAKGDILVFSDANSIYASDALRHLVANFSDPSVGYVTGKMIYTRVDGRAMGEGCSTYMKYENFLRHYESLLGSIVGVDGGIDACRKELYQPMNPDQLPDFVLPLKVVAQSYRVVYEEKALLKEPSLSASIDEYRMRVRVALRALWALNDMKHLLSFARTGIFAWQLWSHKVLRYLGFCFLFVVYISNLILITSAPIFKLLFIAQNILYLGATASPFFEKKGFNFKLMYFVFYFSLVNIAFAHALMRFILRQKQILWTPRVG